MFFYVDESGHTGANLFDPAQPWLYYGVISRKNMDVLAEPCLARLKHRLGVERLHAAELGNARLVKIAEDIYNLQKKLDIRFFLCRVAKVDHALISFFDQVFDQGLNPAITWMGYWTPLRYVLLAKLAALFDEQTLKKAWEARIELNDVKAEMALIEICRTIKDRVEMLPDARSRSLIFDTLQWAENNPGKILYNAKSKEDILSITPNIIGFQVVMHWIALRIRTTKTEASRIVVDQQSQFNKAQRTLSEFFSRVRNVFVVNGPGLPEINYRGMPTIPISFASSKESAGLELVDIYLWIFKRFIENREIAKELFPIVAWQSKQVYFDEISINGIADRWERWFKQLPNPTPEQLENAKEILAIDEERRIRGMRNKV